MIAEYEITLDEKGNTTGVEAIALVPDPAIGVGFVLLNAIAPETEMKRVVLSEDKQMLIGPLIIPEQRIARRDEATGDIYNIYYSASTIELMQLKFARHGMHREINLNHNPENPVKGVVVESWRSVSEASDKSVALNYALPVGTWYVGLHIEDAKDWRWVKSTNAVSGFSLEGNFNHTLVTVNPAIAATPQLLPQAQGIFTDQANATNKEIYKSAIKVFKKWFHQDSDLARLLPKLEDPAKGFTFYLHNKQLIDALYFEFKSKVKQSFIQPIPTIKSITPLPTRFI